MIRWHAHQERMKEKRLNLTWFEVLDALVWPMVGALVTACLILWCFA